MSLDQQSEVSYSKFLLYVQIEDYENIEYKILTAWFNVI